MSRRRKGGEERLLDQQQILKEYGLTKAMIRKYFPKPRVKTVHGRHGASWTVGVWPEATVQKMLEHPEIAKLRAERPLMEISRSSLCAPVRHCSLSSSAWRWLS
jgi:hypothetical protein